MRKSFHLRVDHRDSGHVHFAVFVGPDMDHRAKAGDLVLHPDEFQDFFGRLRPDLVTNRPLDGDWPAAAGERTCFVCGCTNDRACDPPCSWIGPELCSHSDPQHMAARSSPRAINA